MKTAAKKVATKPSKKAAKSSTATKKMTKKSSKAAKKTTKKASKRAAEQSQPEKAAEIINALWHKVGGDQNTVEYKAAAMIYNLAYQVEEMEKFITDCVDAVSNVLVESLQRMDK
jgi:hypothetical protein